MRRLLLILLLLAFLCCYLEWPPANSMFIFEAEYEIFTNTKNWVSNFTHPIILAGFVAQLLLLYGALFQKAHRKLITLGILLLGLVVLLFLIVGILGLNAKIILAALPYLCLSGYYFYARKRL